MPLNYLNDTLDTILYLDSNATSWLHPSAYDEIRRYGSLALNPSSPHVLGSAAFAVVKNVKQKLINTLFRSNAYSAAKHDISTIHKSYTSIFTASCTEGNNIVISNAAGAVIALESEHSSIKAHPKITNLVPIDKHGLVKLDALEEILAQSPKNSLLSISNASGDTGVIQPILECKKLCDKYSVSLHLDITQAIGRMRGTTMDLFSIMPDFITMSFHKAGGPQGIGALIYKSEIPLRPLIFGGGQENGLRSGTQNMLGILALNGFLKALDEIEDDYAIRLKNIKEKLEASIREKFPKAIIFGEMAERIPNTTCFSFCNIDSATQIAHFDLAKIAVSSGAACLSRRISENSTVRYSGYEQEARTAIRISFGGNNKSSDVERFISSALQLIS